jgi:hypothetical protein
MKETLVPERNSCLLRARGFLITLLGVRAGVGGLP